MEEIDARLELWAKREAGQITEEGFLEELRLLCPIRKKSGKFHRSCPGCGVSFTTPHSFKYYCRTKCWQVKNARQQYMLKKARMARFAVAKEKTKKH